ncbi:MAG: choline/carnitine O-acyltransferase [Myxococcota bacterium]
MMHWQHEPMRDFYLNNPRSLAFFSNYTLGLTDDPNCQNGIDRAASLIQSWVQHRNVKTFCVAHGGEFYLIDASKSGNAKTTLQDISALKKQGRSSGWLTTLPRSKWRTNPTADLFIALDLDTAPVTDQQFAFELAYGNLANRRFDQPIQLIVFGNGRAGYNIDHTDIDAEPAIKLIDLPSCDSASLSEWPIQRLHFEEANIEKAQAEAKRLLADRELVCVRTRAFQSDQEIQLAIQHAVQKVFGQPKVTSEAVSMSHLPAGRYNTVYFASPEDVQHHAERIKAAKAGEVFGPMPCDITTSSAGMPEHISLFGFTDTEPNIIGIAYLRKPNETLFHIKADGRFKGFAEKIAHDL